MTLQKDPEGSERRTLHQLVHFTGRHVLEIGCGEGRLTWKYARPAKQVVGIDLEADDLRVASIDRPSDLAKKVLFARASGRDLPFPDGKFEIAILAWSL